MFFSLRSNQTLVLYIRFSIGMYALLLPSPWKPWIPLAVLALWVLKKKFKRLDACSNHSSFFESGAIQMCRTLIMMILTRKKSDWERLFLRKYRGSGLILEDTLKCAQVPFGQWSLLIVDSSERLHRNLYSMQKKKKSFEKHIVLNNL